MHVLGYTSVHAHYLLINECHERHIIEAIIKGLPERDLVPSLDLVKEPIDSRDGLTLVVASQNDDLLWISHFKGE